MKIIFYALILSIFVSCAPKKYLLILKMEPSTEPGANYENDSIRVHFNVTDYYIGIRFQNKLSQGIKINWDELSFSLNGKSYARIVHKETSELGQTLVQPTTAIPPNSYLDDILYPRESINYSTNNNHQKGPSISMFKIKGDERNTKMKARIGDVIVVHLPYYVGNSFFEKNFKITIIDVQKVKKK